MTPPPSLPLPDEVSINNHLNPSIKAEGWQDRSGKCCDTKVGPSEVIFSEMANLVGKWEIFSSENFDEYMKAIGVTKDNIEKAQKALSAGSKLKQELSNNGNSWTLKTVTAMGEKEVTFNLGEEFTTTTLDGRKVTVTVTEEGGSLVEVQKGTEAGFETQNVRTASGSEMTMTMTGTGPEGTAKCIRKYKKVD